MTGVRLTTSWDDGHALDLRVADLLDKYGYRGTFYIAQNYVTPRLSDSDLRELATRHEIGAHTLTHPKLSQIPLAQAQAEIVGSKQWLEDVLGREVTAFCYPRGDYNEAVKGLVRGAGFHMARTVEAYRIDAPADPFAMPTSVQVYPFPRRPIQAKNPLRKFEPLRKLLPHVVALRLRPFALLRWERVAIGILERAIETNGVWHLWGHSWEVEQYGMWQHLESVLKLAKVYGGQRVTNGELVEA
jgi:peptidoglycan-N-acetylglucosamine deacetylase